MRSRHPQLLGTSFEPAPPRLSPPALDLSPAAPAHLSHRSRSLEKRQEPAPVLELIAGAPSVAKAPQNKGTAKCFIASVEQDNSAISDTEETPREITIPYAARRNRSAKPRQRNPAEIALNVTQAQSEPKPDVERSGNPDENDESATAQPAGPPEWDASKHCHLKRWGRCVMDQVAYSTYCTAHACQAVLEDGHKCGNLVVNPTRTRFCRKGYHKETSTLHLLDELKQNRLKQNELEKEQHLSDLQEGRDWVIAQHPDLMNDPPLVHVRSTATSQPMSCPPTSSRSSGGSSSSSAQGIFDCYSPDDWIGGMWYIKHGQAKQQQRPQLLHTQTSATVMPIC